MAEQTLVLIKPDAMQRRLAGEILARFEGRGLTVRGAKLVQVDRDLAEQHYAEHVDKPFFGELVEFITSSPTLALVLEGEGAIKVVSGLTSPPNNAANEGKTSSAVSQPAICSLANRRRYAAKTNARSAPGGQKKPW